MATVKVKYRPSSVDTKEGIIYYQIIHKRVARQSKTGYHLFKDEWDDETQTVKTVNGKRSAHLHSIKEAISCDIMRINAIITKLDSGSKDYTADDIVNQFNERKEDYSFFIFMQGIIDQHRKLGKIRTAETYTSSMNSFKKFVRHYSSLNNDHISEEIFISEIDSYTISTYESYLKQQGLSPNTTSFYMRNLRAVYNRAIESQLSLQQHPFKHVYTGVEKTIKRAVTLNTIRKIRDLNLTTNPDSTSPEICFYFHSTLAACHLSTWHTSAKKTLTKEFSLIAAIKQVNNSLSNGKNVWQRLSTNTILLNLHTCYQSSDLIKNLMNGNNISTKPTI